MRMTPRVTLIPKWASSTTRHYRSLAKKIATTWRQEFRKRVSSGTTVMDYKKQRGTVSTVVRNPKRQAINNEFKNFGTFNFLKCFFYPLKVLASGFWKFAFRTLLKMDFSKEYRLLSQKCQVFRKRLFVSFLDISVFKF